MQRQTRTKITSRHGDCNVIQPSQLPQLLRDARRRKRPHLVQTVRLCRGTMDRRQRKRCTGRHGHGSRSRAKGTCGGGEHGGGWGEAG